MRTVRDPNVTQESLRSSEAKDWHSSKTQGAKATPSISSSRTIWIKFVQMTVDWAARNTDRNNHIVYTSRNINYKDIAIADAGNIKSAAQKASGSGQGSGAANGCRQRRRQADLVPFNTTYTRYWSLRLAVRGRGSKKSGVTAPPIPSAAWDPPASG
jgi:hypothetical protein